MSSSASRPFVPSAPRLLGSSAPRLLGSSAFSVAGLYPAFLTPVFLLGVISQVSLQPLPGLPSFRKPTNSGSEGDPDSARKSPAFPRMFEKRLRGARAFRGPHRSVSARRCPAVRRAGPALSEDGLATLALAAGLRGFLSFWKEPVCLWVSGKAVKQIQTSSCPLV